MGVGGARCQEDGVGVPGEGGDGTANGLLQMLRNPPVILLLKIADGDHTSSRTDGKLLLGRRPPHKGGCAVDAEQDEGRLPASSGLLPDIGIAVYRVDWELLVGRIEVNHFWRMLTLGASDNTATVGSNVNTGDSLVVALQLITERELVA